MVRTPFQIIQRVALLAAGTLICAAISNVLGMIAVGRWTHLRFDTYACAYFTLFTAAAAFPFTLVILWPVNLRRAIPAVTAICVLASICFGLFAGPFSLVLVFLFGICAMVGCRARSMETGISAEKWKAVP